MNTSNEEQAALGLAAFTMMTELLTEFRKKGVITHELGQSIMLRARDRLHRLGPTNQEALAAPGYKTVEATIQGWIASKPS